MHHVAPSFLLPQKQSLHHQLYGICKGKGQSFAICVFCILVRCVNERNRKRENWPNGSLVEALDESISKQVMT